MARVLKRPQAQADLIEIWDYIAQDSEESADAFLDTLNERFDLLADQPQLGRERPELGEGIRSFPIGRYLVYYRALRDGIEIERVLHSARDIIRLFRQE
jgi:toxin ParE1/3/4